MTKKQKSMYEAYLRALDRDQIYLSQCYRNPSYFKDKAYTKLLQEFLDMGGIRHCIPSFNSNFFTFAFTYPCHEDGTIHLRYHTHCNVYDFALDGSAEI